MSGARRMISAAAAMMLMSGMGLVAVSEEEQQRRDKTPPPSKPRLPEQIGPESRQVRRARERREAKRKTNDPR